MDSPNDPDHWPVPGTDHRIPNWFLRMLVSDRRTIDAARKHLIEWEKRQPREGDK